MNVLTRRTVLRAGVGTGVLTAVAALSACTGRPSTSDGGSSPSGGPSRVSPSSSASSSPSSPFTPAGPEPEIKFGSKDPAVAQLQARLAASGYWLGTPDGAFGILTQQAVWAVQKQHGLDRDGVVGAKTWAAVDSDTRPQPRSGVDGIEIDKDKQLLLVVRGGATALTLNVCTAGGYPFMFRGRRIYAVTPPGDFSVHQTWGDGWQDGLLGRMWRPYYFNGDIAVHGADDVPPFPVSHGCCRVTIEAQNMLIAQSYLAKGTSVRVY